MNRRLLAFLVSVVLLTLLLLGRAQFFAVQAQTTHPDLPTPAFQETPAQASPDTPTTTTLNWTAPVGNGQVYSVVSGSVTLAVSASNDSGSISLVTFKRWDAVNNVWITIDFIEVPPYQVSLDASTLNPGWNQINATAAVFNGGGATQYIWIDKQATLPTVQFRTATLTIGENGTMSDDQVVTLSAVSDKSVTVQLTTSNGTAIAGSDYIATNATLTFPPGTTVLDFIVPILDDAFDENDETINVKLRSPTNATLGALTNATLTIVDNDAPTDVTRPTVNWVLPVGNNQVYTVTSGSVNLAVTATDDSSGVNRVEFWRWDDVQGVGFAIDNSAPYQASLNVDSLNPGRYEIQANAIDNADNLGGESIWIVKPPICYTLTTIVSPGGSGTITSSPQPNCQGNKYTQGTVVSLSATANAGYSFSQWGGAASGKANPLSVTMDRNKSITANFSLGNIPPVANSQNVSTAQDTAKNITLTGSDANNDPLTYSIVSNPSHGTLSGTPPNLTYTPSPGFSGADSFTFRVNDGQADSIIATVNITVVPSIMYAISGRVTDANNNSISAVTISDGAGHTIMTDANGNYTLSGLAAGTYSLTASKSGYTFSPSLRTVTVPPTAPNMNFTGTQQRLGELEVTALEPPIQTTCAGGSNDFNAFVRNNGVAQSGAFDIQWNHDGQLFEVKAENTGMPPGASLAYPHVWANISPGQHTLTFIADATNKIIETNEGDNQRTITFTAVDCTPPVANFTASPVNGNAPINVSFHNGSTGNISSCGWDYGDGQTENLCTADHNHIYNAAGTYTVKLTVSGLGGSNTQTKNNYITVSAGPPCYTLTTTVNPSGGGTVAPTPTPNCQGGKYTQGTVVSLSATANTGYAFSQWSGVANGNTNPVAVTMDGDKSITANFNQPAPTGNSICGQLIKTGGGFYQWFLPCSGNPPLMLLGYSQPVTPPGLADGAYYRVNNPELAQRTQACHPIYGCTTTYLVITVDGSPYANWEQINSCDVSCSALIADFDATPLSGTAPLPVLLRKSSLGSITHCLWDYGDGTTGESCADNHNHIYTEAGTYTITLTVFDSGGSSNKKTRSNYIFVKAPIVLLPGIMGSRLSNTPIPNDIFCTLRPSGEVWPNLSDLLSPLPLKYNTALSTLSLEAKDNLIQSANPCDQISVSGIVDQVKLPGMVDIDSYANFINILESAGYTVDSHPYDWRKDIRDVADDLNAYLNKKYPDTKVVLVGHSQGGLVARQYLHKFGVDHVKMVITVGTPYLGAPQAVYTMRAGALATEYKTLWDYGFNQDYVILNGTLRLIVRNSPAANQLLPSQAYVNQVGSYFAVNSGQLLNYPETRNFLATNGQNSDLMDKAQSWHDQVDAPLNLPDSFYYILVGNHNKLTPKKVYEFYVSGLDGTIIARWNTVGYDWGDGTVPEGSASLVGGIGNASLCKFPQLKYSHDQLLRNPEIQTAIEEILQSGHLVCPGTKVLAAPHSSSSDFRRITVWGPAQVTVTDSARHLTGPTSEGFVVTNIPGSSYEVIGDGTFVTVMPTDTYTIKLKMTSDMPLEVRLENFSVPVEGNSTISQKTVFIEVPSAKGGTAELSYNPTAPATSYQLKVDLDNNGTSDKSLPPDSVLTGAQVNDLAHPVTHITLSGKQDSLGFYTGPVTVNLDATDDLSGIQRVEYSLDGGNTSQIYTGPFTIVAERVPVLYVQATDRAGNAEFPWATARLRPYNLYLPLVNK